jgi:methionine-S-sulfoxide reductase
MRAILFTTAAIAVGLSSLLLIARAQTPPAQTETPPEPASTAADKSAAGKSAAKKSEGGKTDGEKTAAGKKAPHKASAHKTSADKHEKRSAPATAGKSKTATAVFAGGCFWCTEFAFEQLAGVVDVESGYCGGTRSTANYDDVHLGETHHAEAIRVTYNPDKITYDELLRVFFDAHDPTQLNKQGADVGRQYRSAIFYANDDEKDQAQTRIDDLTSRHVYKRKIVTKLEPLTEFYPAETVHQDFARKHPDNPYIEGHAFPRAIEVRTKHRNLLRNPLPPTEN